MDRNHLRAFEPLHVSEPLARDLFGPVALLAPAALLVGTRRRSGVNNLIGHRPEDALWRLGAKVLPHQRQLLVVRRVRHVSPARLWKSASTTTPAGRA